ncbi:MAG: dienelactone hydrolase family protein [Rhodospirillales bacterium]|nr:dienelactone hydrolase family protein [Rhodospirillales bacterium]
MDQDPLDRPDRTARAEARTPIDRPSWGQLPLGRRGVLVAGGLIAGFTRATARAATPAIHTDSKGLATGIVDLAVPGGQMPAWFARPAKPTGKLATILVLEEIFGVHEYIRDVCRRLAKLGYLAIAPELYWRHPELAHLTDAAAIQREVIAKTADADVMADIDATSRWAVGAGGGDGRRIGVLGFCRGGRDTWLYAAHATDLRAAVAFYGPLGGAPGPIQPETALQAAGKIHCPMLALYGGKDMSSTPAQIAEAKAAARAAGRTVETITYPEAGHGFHADYRPSYDPQAAKDGWAHAIAWFRSHGLA